MRRGGRARGPPRPATAQVPVMHTRVLKPKSAPAICVRPLSHGDARTVMSVFERLGEGSRRARFNGPKPCLRGVGAPPARRGRRDAPRARRPRRGAIRRPVGVARLARDGDAPRSRSRSRRIPAARYRLQAARELIAHARAIGVTEITALVASENRAAVALLRRVLGALEIRFDGSELSVRASLASPGADARPAGLPACS